MRILQPRPLAVLLFSIGIAASASALGQTPDDYVRTEHAKLAVLVKQGNAPQITTALGTLVDYDALTRRAFGQPCPVAGCTDHWAQLSPDQQTEMLGLIKQLVQKNYRKNVKRTIDYNVTYSGSASSGANFLVQTVARSSVDVRAPAVFVDYLLEGNSGGPYRVIDIVTERSSTTKNYYDTFHKWLTTPSQGYPHLKQSLIDTIAKP